MGRRRTKKRSLSGEHIFTLPVGARAELRSDDPGFLGSFYEVTITGHLISSGQYTVVYTKLVADDGGPLEETVAAANVRPRAGRRRRGYEVHEAVEAFHNEGWWAGVVTDVPPPEAGAPRLYKVAFPTSRESIEFEETALRPHRVFQAGRWVPAAEVVIGEGRPLFPEGTRVEVSGSAKRFGESWRPASVLKVIGATNFLVKYTHIGNQRELATEILDYQYIRPAYTGRKYKFSPSSRVEVMHEGSWWPCVIMEDLGSGSDKYVVKLKNYETYMDDVESLAMLTVENTQLRQQVRWDGKTWLPHREEKSATEPMLASLKRPISCGLSLHKEVAESSNEHGSHCEKKLKNADVVSEPVPPLLSICNESAENKGNSSSYPGESVKQGNSVLVPPSLALTAGFSHLSDSSLAQNNHPEQASSQKIITPYAPAALFGTFGQTRPLPPGPLFGMQSLNPQTPKVVVASKCIEEARNIVSMLEDLAKPEKGDDSVELLYNVTAGCGTLSETSTVNFVDPTTTPKDNRGSQHAVSQQDHCSAMENRPSESSAIQHFPFASQVRARIEAMEIFREMPQRPNLNHLQRYCPELREGMALGLMLTFAILAESIDMINIHQEDIGEVAQKKKQALSLLEENGFDVRALRSRLEARLCTTR